MRQAEGLVQVTSGWCDDMIAAGVCLVPGQVCKAGGLGKESLDIRRGTCFRVERPGLSHSHVISCTISMN